MDLIIIAILTLLFLPVAHVSALDPLQVALGLPLVLFSPGYALMALLSPVRDSSQALAERAALSIAASLALVPLIGLFLHFTDLGFSLNAIGLSEVIVTLALVALAWRGRHLPSPYALLSTAALRARLDSMRRLERWDVAVRFLLVLALMAAMGGLAWSVYDTPSPAPYTQFFLLGRDGVLGDYPQTLRVGDPQDYRLGIVNQENRSVRYAVHAFLNDEPVGLIDGLVLPDGDQWQGPLTVNPIRPGEDQFLDLLLFRDGDSQPHRTLYLVVDVSPQ